MPEPNEVTDVIDENTAAPASDANTQTLPEDESKNPPDPSAQSEEAVSDTDDEDPKKPGRIPQWRLDEVTRARRDAERLAEDLQRENETLKAQSGKSSPTQPQVQLPANLESLDAFIKANPKITDWDEAQKAFLAARDQHNHQSWQSKWEQERTVKELSTKFDADFAVLPELKELKTVLQGFDKETAGYMQSVAQQFSNGVQVIKEALLTPELREQLKGFERTRNGIGIQAALVTISTRLLMEARGKAEGKEDPPPSTRAPRPPAPVGKATSAKNELTDDLPYKEWERRRNAQIASR